jgi:hypothetical protein
MTASSWPGGLFIALARKFLQIDGLLTTPTAMANPKTPWKRPPFRLRRPPPCRLDCNHERPPPPCPDAENTAIDAHPGPHALFMRALL